MQDSQHCMNFSYYYYIIIIIISRPRVGLSVFVVIIIFTCTSKHSDPHCTMVEGGLDHNLNVSSSTKPIRRTATAAHLVDFLCLLMQLKRDEWVSSKVISIDGSLREVHQMHDLISVCLQPFSSWSMKHDISQIGFNWLFFFSSDPNCFIPIVQMVSRFPWARPDGRGSW